MNKNLSDYELSMMINEFEDKSISNDFEEKEIKELLKNIIFLQPGIANSVSDQLINKIGNNHMGVCFVEFDWVIDFLIMLLENSVSNRARAICILSILNDLCYFEIIEKYPHRNDIEELKIELRNKLNMYSDEFFENKIESLS